MKKTSPLGITLIELIAGIAILGATILVVRAGLGFLMTIFTQTASIETQRDAEVMLYEITKEVRNAKAILAISSGTLTLRSLNTNLGYDSGSSGIFEDVNIGTVTYQYETAGVTSHLKRTRMFSGGVREKLFLKGVLLPPDGAHFIFRPMTAFSGVDPWSLSAPYEGVEVMLEVRIPGAKAPPKTFRTHVIKRSQSF